MIRKIFIGRYLRVILVFFVSISFLNISIPVAKADTTTITFKKLAMNGYGGNRLSCGILNDGSTRCLGDTNVFGTTSVQNATEVAVGAEHACAITSDKGVKCWGRNQHGEVGSAGSGPTAYLSATNVNGIDNAQSLAVGYSYSCASLESGQVKCWGHSGWGVLGPSNNTDTNIPLIVSGLDNVTKIVGGMDHLCALLADTSVKCWGRNSEGEVTGLNNSSFLSIPTFILSGASDLFAGPYSTCAIMVEKTVKCWGRNFQGLWLGDSAWILPTEIPQLANSKQLALGQEISCALSTIGKVRCWGQNYNGDVGTSERYRSYNSIINVPTLVKGLSNIESISRDPQATYARNARGKVYAWGSYYNTYTPVAINLFEFNSLCTASVGTVLSSCDVVSDPISGKSYFIGEAASLASYTSRKVEAETYSYKGIKGHLIAPKDSRENNFIVQLLDGQAAWMALEDFGSMDGYVRNWTINAGNNAGKVITRCTSLQGNSSCSQNLNAFANWAAIEPNNVRLIQRYAYLNHGVGSYGQGFWDDCWDDCQYSNILAVEFDATAPPSPAILGIVPGNMRATVEFMSPSDNGGLPITNYEYSTDGGTSWTAAAPAQTTSPMEIAGLTNGNLYSVRVRALNSIGSGAASNAVFVTPRFTSSAPVISSVSPNNLQATVEFSAPSSDGGANITNYEYSTDGGSTWSAASPAQTSSPLIISGLTNGTRYSVKIRAVNSVGSGAESDAVSVKPVAPASAPTISGAVAGNGQATLSITAPSQINDSSLIGYDYSINNGSTWSSFPSATGPFTITGLTNATAYQVKVRAVNSAGAGEASAAVTVNPTSLVPAKPVISSVLGGNASVTVNIANPADVTAQSITGYHYSIDRGATYREAVVTNGSFTISGLTNGVSTSVQIRATNFNGTSLPSVAKSVIPATTPDAPSISRITRSAGALSIAFTAPKTGGSAITSYHYSLDGGLTWVVPKTAVKSSPIRVTGLPNATNYQVSIRAVNGKGISVASTAVSASTPVVVPSAPVYTSITKTRTTIVIGFEAPANDGGGTITNYAYSTDSGRTWVLVSPASNSTRVVITGLNPSTLYPVQIAAINSAGRGASSALTRVGTLH